MTAMVCECAYKFNNESNYLFVHSHGKMEPRELLRALMARAGENSNSLAIKLRGRVTQPQIYKFINGTSKEPRRATLQPLADHFDIPVEALYDSSSAAAVAQRLRLDEGPTSAIAGESRPSYGSAVVDVTIPQYDAGGSMGRGLVLEERPPGLIKGWRVDEEWLRLNVRHHTGVKNLCIVTGFGSSMRGMFNPGDPLLCDCGVTSVEVDGVFYFRIGEHGFVKMLQRIPTAGGMIIRAKSKNPDYEPFDIVQGMDFQVFAKVLTVWKSDQV